ncbi:MAG TPA: hypothetical protein VG713_09775 [Pirellulales bacterium]|nr:hypothetical protein [Pirellulales bacterium]
MPADRNDPETPLDFEASLRALTPAACPLDRDRLMFMAGAASASVRSTTFAGRLWSAALGAAAASVLLVGAWFTIAQNERVPTASLAERPQLTTQSAMNVAAVGEYLRLRNDALDDRWPSAARRIPSPAHRRSPNDSRQPMLDELLGS